MSPDAPHSDTAARGAVVRRARLEEVQPLAAAYRHESLRSQVRMDPPLPTGAVFWIAEVRGPDAKGDGSGAGVGYAAGTLRPEGLVLGPVYVDPAHRRTGVASQLLADIERWANGASIPLVEVSVAADNPGGVAFLEAAGFTARRLLMAREPDQGAAARPRRSRGETPR